MHNVSSAALILILFVIFFTKCSPCFDAIVWVTVRPVVVAIVAVAVVVVVEVVGAFDLDYLSCGVSSEWDFVTVAFCQARKTVITNGQAN